MHHTRTAVPCLFCFDSFQRSPFQDADNLHLLVPLILHNMRISSIRHCSVEFGSTGFLGEFYCHSILRIWFSHAFSFPPHTEECVHHSSGQAESECRCGECIEHIQAYPLCVPTHTQEIYWKRLSPRTIEIAIPLSSPQQVKVCWTGIWKRTAAWRFTEQDSER